eukprot:TRINITY_DN12143_c0_g1_i2.p1 TRINITY_DN12143_c0_g1~~TRINITY_DN12143_c0_g1_i2.p1  ORF type:complete len:289 (+),score=66.36 TRINITY_DN12143_c0_g1_i2:59-868(+)
MNRQDQIYFEPQESGFCGVHCLNNLLQGAYFTEIDLSQIALELDETERQLMAEQGIDSAEYLRFVAEDSENVNLGGNFSIQVLNKALGVFNLNAINILSEEAKEARRDPLQEEAFICNLESHWFAIRKIDRTFFDLNSLSENGPTVISPFFLNAFFDQLQMEGWSIFVVRGNFPPRNTAPVGQGVWYDMNMIRRSGPRNADVPPSNVGPAVEPAPEFDEDEQLRLALAASLQQSPPSAQPAAPPARAPSVEAVGEEDELQMAIRMSLMQ